MAKKTKAQLQASIRAKLVGSSYETLEAVNDLLLDIADSVVINDAAEGPLTAKDASAVDGTYGAEEAAVIGNNRTRIEELETACKNKGIIS